MLTTVPILLMAGLIAPNEAQQPLPTTFFIVRHAEKDAEENLSEVGKKRAEALKQFLANQDIAVVYSTDFARTRDTAKPTADATKLKIQTYGPMPKKSWLDAVRTEHPGKNVLVVGHSNTVVPIVNGLGANLKHKIGHDDYHNLFIVRVEGSIAQAVRINYGAVPARKKTQEKQKATATP